MTPRFADAVDPILLEMFSLLERIDSGGTVSPAEERRILEQLIKDADQRLADKHEEWELAKYVLVAWIDEMLVDAHIWPGQEEWRENVLEWSLFKMRQCNSLYYIKAKQALNADDGDAIQMAYVCVLMGFRGLYRDPRLNRMLIDQNDLASDLDAWTDEYATAVSQARQRWNESTAVQQYERDIVTALPLWNRGHIVWPWLIAAILVGLNFLN